MQELFLAGAVLSVAFANGANDNFKGVATLHGSRSASYRLALHWATAMTLLGSLCALLLSDRLLQMFSGAGLVGPALASSPEFLTVTALATACTILLATFLALPVSTTHALLGSLVGAGFVLQGSVALEPLARGFVLPLLGAPVVSLCVTAGLYAVFRSTRLGMGVGPATAVAVGVTSVESAKASRTPGGASAKTLGLALVTVSAQQILNTAHFVSAAALSFSRGLNDTPKIAALLLASGVAGRGGSMICVGLAIAVGALLAARRVAATMSSGITPMNDGQGFTANAVTTTLVVSASLLGMPISTTHASCGALFGLGAVTSQGRWRTVTTIAIAWLVTLPAAALIAAAGAGVVTFVR